jgi:mevalonate kinase
VSHQGRRAISSDVAEEVNRWAFVSEKVLHGTPSGVDNSVSVFGGALAYTRSGFPGKKGGMEPIQGFKSLKFLLTDSKVPRDTKALVAGVAARKAEVRFGLGIQSLWLTTSRRILRKLMQSWTRSRVFLTKLAGLLRTQNSDERTFSSPYRYDKSDFSTYPHYIDTRAQALINENHVHLADLGVSHSSLEAIRAKTASGPHTLSTKLTGAGGGGCAVTLLPDRENLVSHPGNAN